ncbi:hypothetical protein QVD17_16852 [Tagetes erecta]|uniref:Uncharacterized protein n=1 Tax=Tagetes erecta TaxID=13708 RepID=A0AAD8P0X4_TARER|nr:hypothetical protein QVD17_16852 [Tagetes erecta]
MTGVDGAGEPDSHSDSGSDSAFISLSPSHETAPPRYVSEPVGIDLEGQMRGNWVSRNENEYMAPVAEVDENLVEIQVGVKLGNVAQFIEDLRVGVEPIVEAQTSRVKFLKEKIKEWERKDDVASIFENGESSNAPTQFSILGEPVERTLVTLVTRCAQYENEITNLKTKVGVLYEVDEATDERLKSYDEERVMQRHTLFQLNDRVRSLEEEMMEVKGRLQITEQRMRTPKQGWP